MNKKIGALAIIFAAVLWAVDGVLFRPDLDSFDVVFIVFLEHFFGLVLISLVLLPQVPQIQKEIRILNSKDWWSIIAVAFFGGFLGTFAMTKAILITFSEGLEISSVLLINKLQPIFAISLAFLILKEKVNQRFFLWAGLALFGSYLLTFGFSLIDPKTNLEATLYALLAAASWGVSTVFSKKASTKISFSTTAFLRFFLTTLIGAFLVLAFQEQGEIQSLYGEKIFAFLKIALFTGLISTFAYYFGIKIVKAAKATIYELAFPIAAVILEYLYFNKILEWDQILGVIILSFAIFMLIFDKERNKLKKRPLIGIVITGDGKASHFMHIYEEKFTKKLRFQPYPGTLNLQMNKPIRKPFFARGISAFEENKRLYGSVRFVKCTVNELPGAIIWPEKSSHDSTVIEIISPYNLRQKLNLKNTDTVEVVV